MRSVRDELALRGDRGRQRVENDVECLGEPPELVAATITDPAAQVAGLAEVSRPTLRRVVMRIDF